MVSLDRFAYGLPDPQQQPIDLVADCANEDCMQEIFLGDHAIIDDDDNYYCCEQCYVRATGARYIKAGLED